MDECPCAVYLESAVPEMTRKVLDLRGIQLREGQKVAPDALEMDWIQAVTKQGEDTVDGTDIKFEPARGSEGQRLDKSYILCKAGVDEKEGISVG